LRRSNGIWNLHFSVWPAAFTHEPGLTGVTHLVTFAVKRTKELYDSGKSKRFPPGMCAGASRRLEYLDLATSVTDLKVPPSNRLHKLERARAGQYSISVNDQWRVCFRFEDGDAYDDEITDYH
jgi:proteic killer suppression protein